MRPPETGSLFLPLTLGLAGCAAVFAVAVWLTRRRDREVAESRLARRLKRHPTDLNEAARQAQAYADKTKGASS